MTDLWMGIIEGMEDVPMHIEMIPNRQSLPLRFISFNRVLTQRAPGKIQECIGLDTWSSGFTDEMHYVSLCVLHSKKLQFKRAKFYINIIDTEITFDMTVMNKRYVLKQLTIWQSIDLYNDLLKFSSHYDQHFFDTQVRKYVRLRTNARRDIT